MSVDRFYSPEIKPSIERVHSLALNVGVPPDTLVVVGSMGLALFGLRRENDIDLSVPQGVFDSLERQGWEASVGVAGASVLRRDVFDIGVGWNGWTHEELLTDSAVVFGAAFASLEKLVDWKLAIGRPQDIADMFLLLKRLSWFLRASRPTDEVALLDWHHF